MELGEAWIREIWRDLLAAADLVEAATVLFVVRAEHDLAKVEAAYMPPNVDVPDYSVLRHVGEARLNEFRGLHRFAIFQSVRDGPLGGFAAMLRHELRHAEQFH